MELALAPAMGIEVGMGPGPDPGLDPMPRQEHRAEDHDQRPKIQMARVVACFLLDFLL